MFRGEISGSIKGLRRVETKVKEATVLETSSEGRVGEVRDYLQTFDSSPTEPLLVSCYFSFKSKAYIKLMQEGLSDYSEEAPVSVPNIKVQQIFGIKNKTYK